MTKTEDIKQIQHAIWGIYKDFLEDKNPDRCRERMHAMMQDFEGSAQYFLCSLIYSWSRVIGGLAEDFEDGRETGKRTEYGGVRRTKRTVRTNICTTWSGVWKAPCPRWQGWGM